MSQSTVIRKIINRSSAPFRISRVGHGGSDVTIDGYDTLDDVSIEIPCAITPVEFQANHLELMADGLGTRPAKVWVGGPGMLVRLSTLPNYNALARPIDGNFRAGGERELIIDSPGAESESPRLLLATLGHPDAFDTPADCWMAFLADQIGAHDLRSVRLPGARFAGSESLPEMLRRQSATVKELFLAGIRFFEFMLVLSSKNELLCSEMSGSVEGAQPFSAVAKSLAELCAQYPGEVVIVSVSAPESLVSPANRDLGAEIVSVLGQRVFVPLGDSQTPTCTKIWNSHKSFIVIDASAQQCFRHEAIHPKEILTATSSTQLVTQAPESGLWCVYDEKPLPGGVTHAENWIGFECFGKASLATNVVVFEHIPTTGPLSRRLVVLASALNSGYTIAAFPQARTDQSTTFFIDDICRMNSLREIRGAFEQELGRFQAIYESPDGNESPETIRAGQSAGPSLLRLDEGEVIFPATVECTSRGVAMLAVETTTARKETYGKHADGQTQHVSKSAFVLGFCGLASSSRVVALWPITSTKQ
jgi:hypothetical protein